MKQIHITYHTVPRETFSAVDLLLKNHNKILKTYIEQLFWWNNRINLISRDVSRETVWEHVRHSLLLSQFNYYKFSKLIVDSGTGGGLPGLPLAVISPSKSFIVNDIVSKKILSVKQMIRKLGLNNVETKDGSVADLQLKKPFLLISKHAFKINDLLQMTKGLPWTGMVFYKGKDFKQELQGIHIPLSISVFELFGHSENPFYKDKAIIVVSRTKNQEGT